MSLGYNRSTIGCSERWTLSSLLNHPFVGQNSISSMEWLWPLLASTYSSDHRGGGGGSSSSISSSHITTGSEILSPLQQGVDKSTSGGSDHPSTTPPSSSSDDVRLQEAPPSSGSDVTTGSTGSQEISKLSFLAELALSVGLAIVTSMILSFLSRTLLRGILPQQSPDPTANETTASEAQVYRRLKQILIKRSGCTDDPQAQKNIVVPVLTSRELQMADEIIDPDDIECTFADIGGLDSTKQEIYELAIVPLLQPHLFPTKSKLIQPVKGVLLYGKPGTGKTMMAKALAKESCAIFLPLQLSKILSKYWGESNKTIAATFSLAHKLQPAVIFIDELDTFLKNSNSETAYMDSIKAEFLTLWDGIATTSQSRVLVLGATNKPQHIDSAILRRMPRAFEVPLPDAKGRLAILQLLLKDENIDDTVLPALPKLVEVTKGYSGSDLKELCKAAAMVAVQEHTAEFARRRVMGEPDSALDDALEQHIRPITEADLVVGLQKVRRTGEAAYMYGKESTQDDLSQKASDVKENSIDVKALQNIAKLFRALSSAAQLSNGDDDGEIPDL